MITYNTWFKVYVYECMRRIPANTMPFYKKDLNTMDFGILLEPIPHGYWGITIFTVCLVLYKLLNLHRPQLLYN